MGIKEKFFKWFNLEINEGEKISIGTTFEFTISKDEEFYISFEPICNHSTHKKGDIVKVSLTVFSDKKLEREEAYEIENKDTDFYIYIIPSPLAYEFTLSVKGKVVDEYSCR